MRRYCIFITIALGILACGGPTGPEEEIVGTWVFKESNLAAMVSTGLEEYLVSQGFDRESARVLTVFSLQELNNSWGWVHINADNTWEDDDGASGTWRIEGDEYITTQGAESLTLKYILDGDTLTLIYPKSLVADVFREGFEPETTEETEALNTLIDNLDDLRVVYTRSD